MMPETEGEAPHRDPRPDRLPSANGPYMGLGFAVAPDARLDNGRSTCGSSSAIRSGSWSGTWSGIAFGRRAYAPLAITLRAADVR